MRLAVAASAARVAEIDHVALRRQEVELVHEKLAILRQRPAVDFQDRRVFLLCVEAGREHDPALQVVLVRPLEPDFLDLRKLERLEQSPVDARQVAGGLSVVAQFFEMDLTRVVHLSEEVGHPRVAFVERISADRATLAHHVR